MTQQLLNISSDDAEEYSRSLAQIGEGWWRQIAWAFRQGIPHALGMSAEQWKVKYFGHIRVSRTELPKAAAELKDDGLTQRESAQVLGVGQGSVSRALADPDGSESEGVDENHQVGTLEAREPDPSGSAQLWDVADEDVPEEDEPESEPIEESEPEPEEVAESESEAEPLVPADPGWHQLGDHLLYCGDSTDEEFIKACEASSFAFADPPYNAGKAEWDEGFVWQHDYLAETAAIVAVTPGIAALAGFLANTEMPYQWSMAAEITNGMTSGALRFGNWICVTLFAHGSIYRKAKDHVRIPVATGDDQGGSHPSRKPIRLLTHLIELFTTKGDTVIDPFLGSGTTLMAAELTGRRCIGAELDPMHCAEIIARYRSEAGPL